jgi:hypothetical protein
MKTFRLVSLASCLGALLVSAACGDDDALVRPRLDAGSDAPSGVVSDAGNEAGLGCGAELPVAYESAGFATNAAVELALAQQFDAIETKMRATEGASDAGATSAELKAIYNTGAPSLRSLSTTSAQSAIDGYFEAFEVAVGKTWRPEDAEQEGGAAAGGKYGDYHFSKTGVDLREAAQKTMLGGAFFNRVLGLVASPVTASGTVDSLLAAFGADPTSLNAADDAGADAYKLIAEYARRRDDKASATPGPYRTMRTALLTMKAAIGAGAKCDADRDQAVTTFLSQWERATYGTAIYYLNAAALAAADPMKGPQALHAFGEALGFIQSFKELPTGRRKIADAQIDALLVKIGAETPYKLVTSPGDRALKLNEAINDIGLYEGFTAAEIDAFRTNF